MATGAAIGVLLALAACAAVGDGRAIREASGAERCEAACATPVLFRSIRPDLPTSYACAAQTEAGQVIGFQAGNGSATCTIAAGDEVIAATDYTCVCKEPNETQGLDRPGSSGACADSCTKSIDGEVGKPVEGSSAGYACLATPEFGTTNRFGYQSDGGTCSYASGTTAQRSDSFSCVCLFSIGVGAETSRAPAGTGAGVQPVAQVGRGTATDTATAG